MSRTHAAGGSTIGASAVLNSGPMVMAAARATTDADGCSLATSSCQLCVTIPECGWCKAYTDVEGCFNRTKYRRFCTRAMSSHCQKSSTAPSVPVVDYDGSVQACLQQNCTGSKQRCRTPLLEWLLRNPWSPSWSQRYTMRTFQRMDVLLKAAVIDAWVQNSTVLDDDYHKLMRSEQSFNGRYDPAIRLDMFKGLFENVREFGFDPARAIPAKGDFALAEGTHRVSVLLALNASYISLQRDCRVTGFYGGKKASNPSKFNIDYMRQRLSWTAFQLMYARAERLDFAADAFEQYDMRNGTFTITRPKSGERCQTRGNTTCNFYVVRS